MGKQRRNPWNVLLFFLVIVIVAYLCKRGWDGFYAPGTINIVEASYGANCIGGNRGNRTSFFKSLADGKNALDYIYNFRNTGGDPAPYCPKNLDITYNCGDAVSKYWGPGTRPEAGDDSPVSLRCPVAPVVAAAAQAAPPPSAPPPASTGVYCIAEVRSSVDVWTNQYYFDGVWIKNAPPVGNGVYWIWGVANSAYVSRPVNEAFTFYHSYNNTTGTFIEAKIYGGADNYATVTINGEQLPQISGSLDSPYNVKLLPGNNNIQIFGQNESIERPANPAAVWLMIKDNSGKILVKTDCTNWSTSPPAAPGYMPPQTVNLNPVRRTKTCSTCPSAPLLSSLPTPSIAHNVNLPHYCQRITDDGGL